VPDPIQISDDQVLQFIAQEIDSVPELEALLLMRQHRPAEWTAADLAKRLYIPTEQAQSLLMELSRKQFVAPGVGKADSFYYESKAAERDHLIARTEEVYRRQIVRISTLIHSKPSSAIRDFARAFRFTKEK
jgi:predicted ArsR family transcriptional regulator